ncbi:glycosyltransferase [Lysinibacillus sp. RC79]|uniref:glycosyltransferase n=1 Tax=Lysinibacillus sp. RC79 TaxID=3156296 RepID=UPI00351970DA
MKKILHIIPTTDFGGVTTMILDIWANTNKSLYQFDFVVFNKGRYHDYFMEQGSQLFYQKYITKQGPLAYVMKIYKIIKENGYDAVHDHTGYRAVFTLLAARLAGVKCRVLHSHTNVAEEWSNKYFLSFLKKISVMNATKLVACSTNAGKFCFGEKSFDLLFNPMDIYKIKYLSQAEKKLFKKELGISDDDLVLGHIGRFVPVKNQQFLLKLATRLKQKHIKFKLLLIGEGPLEEEIRMLVEHNHLQESVKLLGQRADIFKLLQLFDKFILPSKYEGFGIVLLEAQVCGTPSLVSTTVPREVDLNVGLIQYLDINGDIEDWLQEIIKKNEPIELHSIIDGVENKGLNAEDIAKKMCSYYI